jgi:hypothetical protein
MYITVQYKNKEGAFGGREYTYICDLSNVEPGDLVTVPVGKDNEERPAMVAEINVPDGRIDERVMPLLKSVIGWYEPDPATETADEMSVDDL